MSKKVVRKQPIRYEENPFLDGGNTVVTTRKKNILIGRGDDVWLNQETGEQQTTNVIAVREVDDAQFVKLFTQNLQLMLELTAAGNKAFVFLLWAVQRAVSKDFVSLGNYELDEFLKENSTYKMSEATMRRGLSELVRAKIIAHSKKSGNYFINPNFIFNGDRVRFITEIRRKSRKSSSNSNNMSLDLRPTRSEKTPLAKQPIYTDYTEAQIQQLKEAFLQNQQGSNFAYIYAVRRQLNWPRKTFDDLLRSLRSTHIFLQPGGMMDKEEIKDSFIDEFGTRFDALSWRN